MKQKTHTKHPYFLLGLAGYIILLIGVVVLSANLFLGRILVLSAFMAIGVHWILSLIHVLKNEHFRNDMSRFFWLALVIMVPPLAGMIYFMVESKNYSF